MLDDEDKIFPLIDGDEDVTDFDVDDPFVDPSLPDELLEDEDEPISIASKLDDVEEAEEIEL